MKKLKIIAVILIGTAILSIEARIDLSLAICDGIGVLGTAFIFRDNIIKFIKG